MFNNLRQSLFSAFSQLQMRQKIILGVGSLLLLGILTVLSFNAALSVSDSALHKVTNEEEPTSAAAYEMSVNVANSGSTLTNYLRTGDMAYRDQALDERVDFENYLDQYVAIANSEQETLLANQVRTLFAQYADMAEQLMAERPEQDLNLSIAMEQLELTEDIVEEGLAKLSARRSNSERRLFLQEMKSSISNLGRDLSAYLRLGHIQSSQSVSDEAEQFLVQLSYYRNLNLGPIETNRSSRIQISFNAAEASIRKTMQLHDETEEKLMQLYDIRAQLNDLISGQMLPIAKNDLEAAKLSAENITHRVKFWALLVSPIGLGLSALVAYLLTRSVTHPTRELVAGANALKEGDLEFRIPDLGDDELGVLGRQFNQMAERLQQTTVSRDKLEESEERYARAVSGTNDGLFDCDLDTGEVYYSPRWITMLGYDEDTFGNSMDDYFKLVHPDDVELLRHNIDAYVQRPGEYLQHEHRVMHEDGSYRWVLCRAVVTSEEGTGRPNRLSGSQTDIHAQKQAEQQLIHDAMHDRLTGLPNRHLLLDRLQHFLDNKKRRETEMAGLLFLDLDGFKMVNDSLGHAAGDRLLIALAHRLSKLLKSTDTLARFGGDEFVILVEELSDQRDIEKLADRIHEALELPFVTGNGRTFLGTSIGMVLSGKDYQRGEDMLRDADIAMYRAKAQGKKRHVLFDQVMHGHVANRLQLENDLRVALENEELEVHYQPIIDLQESRKLVGFEALLRWNHPVKGLLYPDEFVPLLEESGFIIEVGEWLLSEVCTKVKTWHRKNYTPWVSVNVSAVQLRDAGLVASVAKALEDSQLAPQYLTLEITESNVMKNETLARGVLNNIKKMGIKLSMDDFGVGYSSLSYLKRFPWDYVKIDRSFVHDLEQDPEATSIIEAIIVMVHSLKFDVVAEGIETVEQLEILRRHGIDCVQGYLLSHPKSAEAWDGLTSLSSKGFLKNAMQTVQSKLNQT